MLLGRRQTGEELVDVDLFVGEVAGHHRAHIEVDMLQGVAEAADIVVVGEPGFTHLPVQVEDLHGLAAGAHVDPLAAETEIVLRVATGQKHLADRRL